MKTYEWQEVVDYLNNNLDKEFNFGNAFYDEDCKCLMASFFKDKGEKCHKVDYDGFKAETKSGNTVAEVINAPFKSIERIHSLQKEYTMGSDIKEKLDEVMKQI